jgi:hypothetical protein
MQVTIEQEDLLSAESFDFPEDTEVTDVVISAKDEYIGSVGKTHIEF